MARRPRSISRFVIVVLVAVYFPMINLTHVADSLLLFPSNEARSADGAEQVFVDSPQGRIEFWVKRTKACAGVEPHMYVLHFTGNAGRAEDAAAGVAQLINDRPAEVWAMNWPGFGQSAGPATLQRIWKFGDSAFDHVHTRATGRPVLVFGLSMGTAVSLHVAAHKPVSALLLQNPPPLKQIITELHGWWNLWVLAGAVATAIPPELDSIANAQQSRCRAVFLIAELDTLVPPKFQRRVHDAYAGEKRVIDLLGASHNDWLGVKDRLALAEAMRWLLDE